MGLGNTLIIMELIPDNSIEPTNDIKKGSNYQEFEVWERMTGEPESQGVRFNQVYFEETVELERCLTFKKKTYLKIIKTGSKLRNCSFLASTSSYFPYRIRSLLC